MILKICMKFNIFSECAEIHENESGDNKKLWEHYVACKKKQKAWNMIKRTEKNWDIMRNMTQEE